MIEILVVIGIIALLAAVVIIAINPARQFAQARDSQRSSNVNAILNAYGQNLADNKGISTCAGVPVAPAIAKNIGTGGAGLVDLHACLVPTYLPAMVFDPQGGSAADTKYTILEEGGRITVAALNAEITTPIEVTR